MTKEPPTNSNRTILVSRSPPQTNPTTRTNTTTLRDAISGACAGALSKTAVAPIERVKLLLQLRGSIDTTSTPKSKSVTTTAAKTTGYGTTTWNVLRNVYREEGLIAFWRGNTAGILQKAGSSALNFLLMDRYKASISRIASRYRSTSSTNNSDDRTPQLLLLLPFLSAAMAAGTTTTFLYPIEFLRTRLAMDVGRTTTTSSSSTTTTTTRTYPRGMRDVLYHIIASDGIRGVYRGYAATLYWVVVFRGIHLGGYDAIKSVRRRSTGRDHPSIGEQLGMAQLVTMIAGIVAYPLDSVRRRLMMQAGLPEKQRLYRTTWECVARMGRKEGFRGFFLGLGPYLSKSFGGALLLVAYDGFRGK